MVEAKIKIADEPEPMKGLRLRRKRRWRPRDSDRRADGRVGAGQLEPTGRSTINCVRPCEPPCAQTRPPQPPQPLIRPWIQEADGGDDDGGGVDSVGVETDRQDTIQHQDKGMAANEAEEVKVDPN